MKKLTSKKLTRESLRKIQGAAGQLCCAVSCANENECAWWTQLPTKCPIFPICL